MARRSFIDSLLGGIPRRGGSVIVVDLQSNPCALPMMTLRWPIERHRAAVARRRCDSLEQLVSSAAAAMMNIPDPALDPTVRPTDR
jgi:hypothetical protein